jgi:hypothetical protein
MNIPDALRDLERLVANQIPESLHLDYKDSRALQRSNASRELPKDVSAFANSDGGLLIYGIQEEGSIPVRLDGGIANSEVSREWIEQTINSNISPRIEGLKIRQIPISDTHSAYIISVPKSYRAPHQERKGHKYYKRYNFESLPMEDYEITDLRSRSRVATPLVDIAVEVRHGVVFVLVITNKGEYAAKNVKFDFSPRPTWATEPPAIITQGINVLLPGNVYYVYYCDSYDLDDSNKVAAFEIHVSYEHPAVGEIVRDVYPIDLRNYLGTWASPSPIEDLGKMLEKSLRDIRDEVRNLHRTAERLTPLAGGTGLRISVGSIREILGAFGKVPEYDKRNPKHQGESFFAEVLGVEPDLAYRLSRYFRGVYNVELQSIEGMTPALLEKIQALLLWAEPDKATQHTEPPPGGGTDVAA